jgi:hypothetical protein
MKIEVRARFPAGHLNISKQIRIRALTPIFALLIAPGVQSQTEEVRTLQREDGSSVTYTLRTHPADAHLLRPDAKPVPTSALDSAKLIIMYLSDGDIEQAALLSNAPRRRYEELTTFRKTHGDEQFKRLFAEYFDPKNSVAAEIVVDDRSLLIWRLINTSRPGAPSIHYAGQFFVQIDGAYLIDDVPNEQRTRLRWVLDAYRAGKIPAKPSP